jgi:hypothetical protein
MAASQARAVPPHGSLLMWSGSRMAASPSTGTRFRTRRLKLNRRADDRCSATGSRPEYGSIDAQAAKSGDRALGDLPPALSWQSRSPSGSKSIRKNCVSWNRKAPCCARSSPLKAQKRRVLACPVLYRNGAPKRFELLPYSFLVGVAIGRMGQAATSSLSAPRMTSTRRLSGNGF